MLYWILWLIGAYLLGSVSFALILGKLNGINIREYGSGNVGATNLGRALGKKWGLTCFFLDLAKGLVPVLAYGLATGLLDADPTTLQTRDTLHWLAIAAAAILGHVFPIFLKFKGGKGVATSAGALLGFWPVLTVPALVSAVVWFITTKATGYVGLASVLASAVLPVLVFAFALLWGYDAPQIAVYTGLCTLLAALVIFRHRGNLARIKNGTEAKVQWAGRHKTDKA